jgi:hypothetical protein
MSGSKAARKIAMLRKGKPEQRHARFYEWELQSAAFRSLDVYARALLIEFKALYNGANNGELYMSVRDAAKRLDTTNLTLATAALRQLEHRGFIVATRKGVRTRRGETKLATSWRLTEFADDLTDRPATMDFMRWRPSTTPAPDDAGKRARLTERARKAARARWARENPTVCLQASDRMLQASSQPAKMLDRSAQATVEPDSASTTVCLQATQIHLPGGRPADMHAPGPGADPTPSPGDPTPTTQVGVGSESGSEQKAPGASAKTGPDLSRWPKGRTTFGRWLGKTRNALRIEADDLAAALDITAADLHAIETGQRELGIGGMQTRAVAYLRDRAS